MIVTKNWLNEFVDLREVSTEALCVKLNEIGLEVDGVRAFCLPKGVVVGFVKSVRAHENSDHLNVCEVDLGARGVEQIVCGAANVAAGQFVAVATVGTVMPNGLVIAKSKLRGVESNGMICSSTELGLAKTNDGIMLLDESVGELVLGRELREMEFFKDDVIELGVTPNRADCLGVFGVARDLAAAFGKKLSLNAVQKTGLSFAEFDATSGKNTRFEVKFDAPKILSKSNLILARAKNPKPTLKTTLRTATCASFSECALQNLLTYILLETNTAICALSDSQMPNFEEQEEGLTRAVVAGGAPVLGLDVGKLEAQNLLILSFTKPEVVANALAKNKELKAAANKELSYRTARGSEPNFAVILASLARNFDEVAVCGEANYENYSQREVSFTISEINALVGAKTDSAKVAEILLNLEFKVEQNGESFKVLVPPHRGDIANTADIAEEVVRFVGIDNIAARPLVLAEANRQTPSFVKYQNAKTLRHRAAAEGFFECVHYAFDSSIDLEKLGFTPCKIAISNPISSELDALKPTLLNHLLRSAERNVKNRQKRIWLFEYGEVFDENGAQSSRISFVATGAKSEVSLANGTKTSEFSLFEFASKVQNIIGKFELKNAATKPFLSPFESGVLVQNGVEVGFLGRLDVEVAQQRELGKTYVCEIDFDKLSFAKKVAQAYSKFPSVTRDISVVVANEVRYEEVREALAKPEILRSFGLIDDFALEGEKSLTIRLEFVKMEATLTDDEVNAAVEEILASLAAIGAKLR